jgi:Tol biopolymer transport system component
VTGIIGSELNPATGKHRLFSEVGDECKRWLSPEDADCITPSWRDDNTLSSYVYVKIVDNTPWITTSDGRQVTRGLHPDFSPDGTKIIFTTLPTGKVRSEVAVVDLDGSNLKVLTKTTVPDRQGHIQSIYGTFSPDGSKIVCARSQGSSLQIWVLDADGSNPRQITGLPKQPDASLDANAPSWSRDGSRVAYFCGTEGQRGTIYVHNGTRGSSLLPTGSTENSDNPAWSLNSEWICFESDRVTPGETSDPRTRRSRTWVTRSDGNGTKILKSYPYGAGRRPWV